MNIQEIVPFKTVFYSFFQSSRSHLDYLKAQRNEFNKFTNNLIQNAETLKTEMMKNAKNQEGSLIITRLPREKEMNWGENHELTSIKHLKISEESCLVQKVTKETTSNTILHAENRVITPFTTHNPATVQLFQPPKAAKTEVGFPENLNGSFQNMALEESKGPLKQKVFLEGADENKEQKSPVFLKSSNQKADKKRSSNRFSIRMSQIVVDPEKEKRKSQMLKKLADEKNIDEIISLFEKERSSLKRKSNIAENEAKVLVKKSGECEEFFSLEHELESDTLNQILQNSEEKRLFSKSKDQEKNPENNYRLTDYSSNESSNDGSYIYEWRDVEVSGENEHPFNDENSLNFSNFPKNGKAEGFTFNNKNEVYPFVHQPGNLFWDGQKGTNDIFFSQKTDVFGIFKNPEPPQKNGFFSKFLVLNQPPAEDLTQTLPFKLNPMDNQKRISHLQSSPQKREQKKYEKKLICVRNCIRKIVPDWASDMNLVKNKLLDQKTIDPNLIFGQFVIDNLDMKMLFNDETYYQEERGSSANWKNEQMTPDSVLIKTRESNKRMNYSQQSFKKSFNVINLSGSIDL